MGSKCAPIYATLTVGYLEEKLYKEIQMYFGSEFGTYFINNWKRFFDISWTKSVKDLEQLQSILNNLHKDLNFTLEYSGAQQSFLGVLVKNQGGKI